MKHIKNIDYKEFKKSYQNKNIIGISKSSIDRFIKLNDIDFRIKNLNRDNVLEILDLGKDEDIFLMSDEMSKLDLSDLVKISLVLHPKEIIMQDYKDVDGEEFSQLRYSIYSKKEIA